MPDPKAIDPRVKARYIWDPERQRAVEKHLEAERQATEQLQTERKNEHTFFPKRTPRTMPALSLSGRDIGSTVSIKSEFTLRTPADGISPVSNSFFRRTAPAPTVPIRMVPAASSIPPSHIKQPSSDPPPESNALPTPSLSSLAASDTFFLRGGTKNASATQPTAPNPTAPGPKTPVVLQNNQITRPPSFPEIGRATVDREDKTPVAFQNNQITRPPLFSGIGRATADREDKTPEASSGSWGALEAAGARDAEIKRQVKDMSKGVAARPEWGQLTRKSTQNWNVDDAFWTGQRSNITKSQDRPIDLRNNELTKPKDPDPWALPNRAPPVSQFNPSPSVSVPQPSVPEPSPSAVESKPTVSESTIPVSEIPPKGTAWEATRAPNENNDFGRTKRQDPPTRERRFEKGNKGKRARGGSRFEDEDDGQGHTAHERLVEKRRQKEVRKAQREAERTGPIPIVLPELISITAFANALKIEPDAFLEQLGELGFEGVTLDSLMVGETAALVAQEYGYEPTVDLGGRQDLRPRPPPDDPSVLPLRPPVVTIMGHVDHGKTTILDYLRKSSIAAQEHGGITQHIGAFSVTLSSGKPITFLDTPGHAAFLTMRERGATVTDIVVLVVAADDSVMPQTREAIKHAHAAKVPIIVAINKIDSEGARVDAVKHDLAQSGVEIEDFGGDVQVVCVSGKTGQGMDDLEENILTLSEILDHRAELDGQAEGWVLESSLKPTGKVATVLVKRGTLRPGDYIVAGTSWAKIRELRNEAGASIAEAPPGTPVEIYGWRELPAAGDQVIQSPDEDRAKTAVSYREGLREREKDATEYEAITEARKALQEKRALEKAAAKSGKGEPEASEALPEEVEEGPKIVNFVVKGDVHGSVEAVCASIQEVGSHEVRPRVLRSATGPISEFDVEHAATSKSVIVNFATTTPGHIERLAESQRVRILNHNVIYRLVDDVKATLSEYLAPAISTRVLGDAEILQIFPINVRGRVYKNVAGCRVRNGIVGRNHLYRIIRDGNIIFDGKLETLMNVKKEVMEMRKGTECGMGFVGFQDFEVGDQVQSYEEVKTKRSL